MQLWRKIMKKQQSNLNTSINLSTTASTSNISSSKPTVTLCNGNVGSGTIATSGYITTNTTSPLTVNMPYTSYAIGSSDCYISSSEVATLNVFFQYFTEKEVDELFDKMLSRTVKNSDENLIKYDQTSFIIQKYVQENHCSEDFLLKYYNLKIININNINIKHSRYIRTGEYSNLALLLEVEEK